MVSLQGRGRDLFTIEGEESQLVLLTSFEGTFLRLMVTRRPGREADSILVTDSIWEEDSNSDETIHIFSLASGHLYERFLKIMFLTLTQHTNAPVKFWLLENFLSPKFKEFVPYMEQKYNFSVEYVSYKWPRWLREQTDKQRLIWGYKILFLDVMFPLSLKKVIYVDADQVIRADMKELWDTDLGGAPYGYTPFCDSRSEVEGFKFRKQGYWRDHLQGRPYHISALYVVDLAQFRRTASGDLLRSSYQSLSQDPNSLANLDQDLPNYLQHQVRIFSLPQQWLWCETWCDDATKENAKTIDLCNNPLTKIPKLENAIRVIPEWPNLDGEIKELEKEISLNKQAMNTISDQMKDALDQAQQIIM